MFPTKQKTFKAGVLIPSSRRNQNPNKEVISKLGCECPTQAHLCLARASYSSCAFKGHSTHCTRSTGSVHGPALAFFLCTVPSKTLGECGHQLHSIQSGKDCSAQGRHTRAVLASPLCWDTCLRRPWRHEMDACPGAVRLLPGLPGELQAPCHHRCQIRALHNSPPDINQVETCPWGWKTRTT